MQGAAGGRASSPPGNRPAAGVAGVNNKADIKCRRWIVWGVFSLVAADLLASYCWGHYLGRHMQPEVWRSETSSTWTSLVVMRPELFLLSMGALGVWTASRQQDICDQMARCTAYTIALCVGLLLLKVLVLSATILPLAGYDPGWPPLMRDP